MEGLVTALYMQGEAVNAQCLPYLTYPSFRRL